MAAHIIHINVYIRGCAFTDAGRINSMRWARWHGLTIPMGIALAQRGFHYIHGNLETRMRVSALIVLLLAYKYACKFNTHLFVAVRR
jgi:hypothetical protein